MLRRQRLSGFLPAPFSTLLAALSILAVPSLTGCGSSFFSSTGSGACTKFFHDQSCDNGGSTSSSNFAFVANSGAGTVSGLGISTAGALSTLSGSPLTVSNSQPTAVAVSRNNSFVYVGNLSAIYGYSIASGGALTALSSGAVLGSASVTDMQVTPDGKWLVVLDATGIALDLFSINSSTGALTAAGVITFVINSTGVVPYHLAINPAGTVIAAAMGLGGQILWNFNTTTGAITELSRTTAAADGTTADRALTFDSTGNYIFLTRTGTSQGLVVESVASNGVLTPTSGSPYTTGNTPTGVAIDNTGTYAYVTNQADSTVSGYTIGTNEALTAISGSPFTSGTGATSIAMDSTGKWVLVAAQGGSPDLTLYGFDSTTPGRLVSVSTTSTGTTASFVATSH